MRIFNHARSKEEWVQVPRLYTRATAAQLASDINNAHRRRPEVLRVRGVMPGERWEARWEPSSDGALGDHIVWVRRLDAPPD